MKKLLTILFLSSGILCFGQKKDLQDSLPKLTDTTKFLSISAINRISDGLKDRVSARQYDYWLQMMNQIITIAAQEYNESHKKLPKTTK